MANQPIPDFDTALGQLRNFMAERGYPASKVAWVFREDVSTRMRRVLVKTPLPIGNERIARNRYEQGRSVGIGVCLDVFCRLGSMYCCACWFVQDPAESAQRNCSGLKLCLPADLADGRSVRSRLAWAVHRWLDAGSGFPHFRDFLPRRDDTPWHDNGDDHGLK